MPAPHKIRVPKYRINKTSGRALVEIGGVTHWLGRHGSAESLDRYNRLIAEWIGNDRQSPAPPAGPPEDLTIVELVDRFWTHAEAFYGGGASTEADNYRHALRPLKSLYGPTAAAAFGPVALRAVRHRMIELGWTRANINRQVSRLKHVFKWAVSQELIPPATYHAVATLAGLRRGKGQAAESEPVRPVSDADVDATLPYLSRQVRAMVELQRLTGMRSGEACAMRTCDVDRSSPVWTYRPATHKTAHHGHDRAILIGPKAQAILSDWLRPELRAYLFQPAEADAERRAKASAERVTPLSCGNVPGGRRRRGVQPGECYDSHSYHRAISRACELAFGMPTELRKLPKRPAEVGKVPAWVEEAKRIRAAAKEWRRAHCWHPHQLRHAAGTNIRREYGLDAAKVILGHKSLSVTQVYAEQDVAKARKIMGEVG